MLNFLFLYYGHSILKSIITRNGFLLIKLIVNVNGFVSSHFLPTSYSFKINTVKGPDILYAVHYFQLSLMNPFLLCILRK